MASTPHVAIIGGGSTGVGIARDLSMRGFDVTLFEQGNLTHGTTGRMHGLLHSGGRYAVADQASATECIEEVAANTFEAVEYLRIHEDLHGALDATEIEGDMADEFAYHAPCHARNQGLDRQAVELFRDLDGVGIEDVGESCSGISGTYGWKEEKYEKSMKIGEKMFEHIEHAEGETGMTECPTCAMQMEHGTGYDIRHPLELLEAALVE